MDAVLKTGTLSIALKELVIVHTSQLNLTGYCLASHIALARRLGWTVEQIAALPDSSDSGHFFTPREKVAIHLAEVMTTDSHNFSDAEFEQARDHFAEGDLVELLAAVGLFNNLNHVNNLLRMEPAPPATAEELAALNRSEVMST